MRKIPLANAWRAARSANWKSSRFSLEKAYVCCLLSELAYRQIPKFEIDSHDGIKIVPSIAYSELIDIGQPQDVGQILEQSEFDRYFFYSTPLVVLLGIATRDVTFIAIRGTKTLHDCFTDARFFRRKLSIYPSVSFHRGFLEAIADCVEPIADELDKFPEKSGPIYITGHSLGGAMAAILFSLSTCDSTRTGFWNLSRSTERMIHSSYTFGMPRYGNRCAVDVLNNPYALRNHGDVIPILPPRIFGFSSCNDEINLKGRPYSKSSPMRDRIRFTRLRGALENVSFRRNHKIERYSEKIEMAL